MLLINHSQVASKGIRSYLTTHKQSLQHQMHKKRNIVIVSRGKGGVGGLESFKR